MWTQEYGRGCFFPKYIYNLNSPAGKELLSIRRVVMLHVDSGGMDRGFFASRAVHSNAITNG